MDKKIIFVLIFFTLLFISGCQDTIGRKPYRIGGDSTDIGLQPNGDYICDNGAILYAGSYSRDNTGQECDLATGGKYDGRSTNIEDPLYVAGFADVYIEWSDLDPQTKELEYRNSFANFLALEHPDVWTRLSSEHREAIREGRFSNPGETPSGFGDAPRRIPVEQHNQIRVPDEYLDSYMGQRQRGSA